MDNDDDQENSVDESTEITYEDVPRTELAVKEDARLRQVRKWLDDLIRPSDLSDAEYSTFMRYCTEFFIDEGRLWRKDSHGAHKLIVWPHQRLNVM